MNKSFSLLKKQIIKQKRNYRNFSIQFYTILYKRRIFIFLKIEKAKNQKYPYPVL